MFSQIPKRSPFSRYLSSPRRRVGTDLQSELRARVRQFSFTLDPLNRRVILHIFVLAIVSATAAIGMIAN